MHLRLQVSVPGASQELIEDIRVVTGAWAAIRRRFRRRGVRLPRQLLLGSSFGLVPGTLRSNQEWLEPLRRALRAVVLKRLCLSLDKLDTRES